jgi:hypothetical protein
MYLPAVKAGVTPELSTDVLSVSQLVEHALTLTGGLSGSPAAAATAELVRGRLATAVSCAAQAHARTGVEAWHCAEAARKVCIDAAGDLQAASHQGVAASELMDVCYQLAGRFVDLRCEFTSPAY